MLLGTKRERTGDKKGANRGQKGSEPGTKGELHTLLHLKRWEKHLMFSIDLCHECGRKYKELRLSEREWVCEHCGRKHDRDVNAALNIRDEALRLNQTGQ